MSPRVGLRAWDTTPGPPREALRVIRRLDAKSRVFAALLGLGLIAGFGLPVAAQDSIERGRYLFRIAGCQACHTDIKNKGTPLAGGRALVTPFGTFYGPNITPHPEHGIGGWSDRDFITALRHGVAPDGGNYFPVFPYPSFTGMADQDMLAIKAYLFSLPPVDQPNRPHEVDFPFGWRFLMTFWKWLNFSAGPLAPEPGRSAAWNRGAYLVRALGHCGECHTPRDSLGAPNHDMAYAGTKVGPDDDAVPNITTDRETGIGKWSDGDLKFLFRTGLLPDGDVVGGGMAEVVEDSTSHLTDADLAAMITYLKSLPAIRNQIERKKEEDGGGDVY